MNFLSIVSGLVKLGNLLSRWMRDRQLIQTGKDLAKGKQNEKTLEAIKAANHARDNADHDSLDDELCDKERN